MHLVLSLVDQRNLLVALCLFVNIVSSSCHFKTFFKKLKTKFCFAFLIIFNGYEFVNTHKIFGDFSSNSLKVCLGSLVQSCLQMTHGFKFIQHLFFTDTKSFKGKSLSFSIFKFNCNVKTSFVEVTSCFKVIQRFEIMSDRYISFEAFLELTFSLVAFTINQLIFQSNQLIWRLI